MALVFVGFLFFVLKIMLIKCLQLHLYYTYLKCLTISDSLRKSHHSLLGLFVYCLSFTCMLMHVCVCVCVCEMGGWGVFVCVLVCVHADVCLCVHMFCMY